MFRRAGMVAIAVVLACVPGVAFAADAPRGLTATPTKLQHVIPSGRSATGSIHVTNDSSQPMPVDVVVKSFRVQGEQYNYVFEDLKYNWISLDSQHFTFAPGQGADVNYSIDVPADAASGGYYFAIIASTRRASGSIMNTMQVAVPMFVTVSGKQPLTRTSSMSNLHVPVVVVGDKFDYSYNVKNSGNVHLDGKFVVRIDSLWGSHSEQDSRGVVFPGTVRLVKGNYMAPLIPGVYQITYGYIDSEASDINATPVYFISLPPWSLVLLVSVAVLYGSHKYRTWRKSSPDA